VAAQVLRSGVAAAVPVEAGQGFGSTRLELAAEHISLTHARSIRSAAAGPQDRACPVCDAGNVAAVTILDIPVRTLVGQDSSLGSAAAPGALLLVVNVASKCGLTPQYSTLEKLHEQFADRGFAVVGFPCNQFGGQEPGSADEIAEFCSATYGVTFPMFEKIEVNGPGRHAIYTELTRAPDADGQAGDIQWNFEKFLVRPDGTVAGRFRPRTAPDAPEVVAAIEANLSS
jgi:glutathione peroxidase